MLHIILLILKILGGILLGILALLLVLMLIVFFVPFRYRLSGQFYGRPEADVSLRWLFGALRVQASLRGRAFSGRASFLWLKLFDTEKETGEVPAEENPSEMDSPEMTFREPDMEDFSLEEPDSPVSGADAEVPEVFQRMAPEPADLPEKTVILKDAEKRAEIPKPKKEKKDFGGKISQKIDRAREFFEKLRHKKDMAERLWNASCTQNSIDFGKRALFSILKHIRPNRISGNILFGMDRPSDTGRILGGVCALYPLWRDTLKITPDFERQIFEGELRMKGTVRIYIFVYWALRGLLNKDLRKLIKYMKHIKNKEETLWQ